MAPLIDQPRPEPTPELTALSEQLPDVPSLATDRTGKLYAAEELAERLARTERLIQEARETN